MSKETSMGRTLEAECLFCGYKASVVLGGTMSDFTTNSPHPIICHDCNALRHTNLRKEPLECRDCGSTIITPYGDKTRFLTEEAQKMVSERKTKLPWELGFHTCPTCQKAGLKFEGKMGILFD